MMMETVKPFYLKSFILNMFVRSNVNFHGQLVVQTKGIGKYLYILNIHTYVLCHHESGGP